MNAAAATTNNAVNSNPAIIHLNGINRSELMREAHKYAKFLRGYNAKTYTTYALALKEAIRQQYRDIANAKHEAVRGISFQAPLTIEAARTFFVSNETGINAPFATRTPRPEREVVMIARQFLAAGTTKVTLNVKLSEQPCYHMGYQSLTTVPMTLNFSEAGELLGFNIDAPADLKYVAMFDIWIAK